MDNKQDRKFYWEVKDFLTSQNQNAAIPALKPKVGIADQAKIILERNQPFPAKPLEINNNTLKATCQAIAFHQKQEAGYNPSSKAFSKNNDTNAFRTVNEGFWDTFKEVLFGNQKTYAPTPTLTSDQARQNALRNKANSEQKLTADQLSLERLASGKPLTSNELLTRIASQDTTPGVPLTPEQKRERDLAGELKREEGLERIAQEDIEAEEAGSQIVRTSTGREYGLKPTTTPTTTPASVALGKPATPGVDTEGPPSSLSGSQTSSTTSPAPTSGRSPEQRAADIEKRKAALAQSKREQAERSLAYFETLDSAKRGNERPEFTARRAANIKRLQQNIAKLG